VAVLRDDPYGNFNFLVHLGDGAGGDPGTVIGGFSEVSGLGMEVCVVEYRNGNEKPNTVRRIAGITRFSDVVLRRGVIGSGDLLEWLQRVSAGHREARTVTITLLDESQQPVVTWRLRKAQPRRWVGPALAATGGDVAIEELVLVHEGLETD
jgi:phage tail-like protein